MKTKCVVGMMNYEQKKNPAVHRSAFELHRFYILTSDS
jgi:hypothetical protein